VGAVKTLSYTEVYLVYLKHLFDFAANGGVQGYFEPSLSLTRYD